MMILKHRICPNCLAVMIYNFEKERFECKLCGNVEEYSLTKNIKDPKFKW